MVQKNKGEADKRQRSYCLREIKKKTNTRGKERGTKHREVAAKFRTS